MMDNSLPVSDALYVAFNWSHNIFPSVMCKPLPNVQQDRQELLPQICVGFLEPSLISYRDSLRHASTNSEHFHGPYREHGLDCHLLKCIPKFFCSLSTSTKLDIVNLGKGLQLGFWIVGEVGNVKIKTRTKIITIFDTTMWSTNILVRLDDMNNDMIINNVIITAGIRQ
jgi:hypothetical protein